MAQIGKTLESVLDKPTLHSPNSSGVEKTPPGDLPFEELRGTERDPYGMPGSMLTVSHGGWGKKLPIG